MPTMHDPAHPGESLRDAISAEGWTVTEAARKARVHAAELLAGVEWANWHLARVGAGAGTDRVEQRRVLGATAGAVRLGAGTPPPGTCSRVTHAACEPRP